MIIDDTQKIIKDASIRYLIRYQEMKHHAKCIMEINFEQVWASTALGFEGCGGDMMTEATTTILKFDTGLFIVLYNGWIAYQLMNPNKQFVEDIKNCCIASCRDFQKRYQCKVID